MRKYNRQVKTEPKSGLFWCYACDMAKVANGGKCPKCKSRAKSKRRKRY